jgi:2-oxo-3-hexenedioate decarboxylase
MMNSTSSTAKSIDTGAIAREMKAAQDEVRQIEPFTSRLPGFDMVAAYAVSHLIHQARLDDGAVPVGRKIGFTNPDMWKRYGVREPIWAYMYDNTVVRAPTMPQTLNAGRFAEPKIEPEIIFHFRSAPPCGGDLAAILGCIDWVAHGFEIVQSHFPGWKFQAADTVADWALHGTLLVGEPIAVDRLGPDPIAALASFSLVLNCNGAARESGTGSNVLGSPLAAIAHLIGVLDKQPQYRPLQANEMVTTGTITTAQSVRAGETWQTELSGIALPGLAVSFV